MVIVWERIDGPGLEYCEAALRPVVTLAGRVIAVHNEVPYVASYAVTTDALGVTAAVEVTCRAAGAERQLVLRRDQTGGLLHNGIPLPGFEDCEDVDIEATPATNTLPIRRRQLSVGDQAEVTAIWIRCPDLTVARLSQRYTRLDQTRYRYQSLASGFEAVLTVDGDGIVVAYEDLWRRVVRRD